ncbi:MAG: hypothetical protein WCF26_19105 [Candidatus Sulfotelmatobacter sp.]
MATAAVGYCDRALIEHSDRRCGDFGQTKIQFSPALGPFAGGKTKIYIVKLDGTGLRQVPWSGASGGYGSGSVDPNYFYLGGQESDLAKLTIWRVAADGSSVEKLVDNCGAVWDGSPDGKYLIASNVHCLRPLS